MAHIRLEWIQDHFGELDVVLVDVKVGLRSSTLRDAGQLRLHASEVNSLDRLLTAGALFERPANTYEIVALDAALAVGAAR
jgi:hypothetical protein